MSGNLSFSASDLDYDFFPHTVTVYRAIAAGEDTSGDPVEDWGQPVYKNLSCVVVPQGPTEVLRWEQLGLEVSHTITFPPILVNGTPTTLPVFTVRDRLQFGTYSDGKTLRWLRVQEWKDEGEQGILRTVMALEVVPAQAS